jgi:DNA-binding MarR family transcriptional regulator
VVVRKLHEKGLVGKQPSQLDRRRLDVTLTSAGAKLAAKAPVPVQQVLMARMAQLPPAQLRQLAELLERVAPPMEGDHPAPMFFHEGAAGGRRA